MKLIYKLTLGFIAVALLTWVTGYLSIQNSKDALVKSIGDSSVIIAQDTMNMIDRNIYSRIENIQVYAKDTVLQKLVAQSNQEFDAIEDPQAYIDQNDKEWRAVQKETITPFMNELIHEQLLEIVNFYNKKYGYKVFAEIFVTNKYGANAGQTGKTTDYYQADEKWWQETKEDGLFVSDVAYDASAEVYSIAIGVRVDDEQGNFAGVIKAVLNIEEVIRIIDEIHPRNKSNPKSSKAHVHEDHDKMHVELITKDGIFIYSTTKEGHEPYTKIPEGLFLKIKDKGPAGYYLGDGDKEGEAKTLYSHVHSRGYNNFDGLGWILLIEHSAEEIFAPAMELRKLLSTISLLVTMIVILIGFWVSRSITRPIEKLKNATDKIGKGEMDTIIDINSRDEIGQLARSFNQMTKDLRTTTVNRDELIKEIKMRESSEKMYRDSEERFRSLAESANDAIIYIDSRGEIIFWNAASEIIFGYSADEIVGKLVPLIIPKQFHKAHEKGFDLVVNGGESHVIGKTVEFIATRKDGSEFPIELSLSTWGTSKGMFFTAIIRDISERKAMEDKLKSLSLTDELTGLYNRRGFFNMAEQQLNLAKRKKEKAFLLYLDLDRLKEINDTFGHNEGDGAIKDIAMILKDIYRETDVIGRLGGDEFVVFPIGTDDETCEILVDRLLKKIDIHNRKSNKIYKLSISVGVAHYDPKKPCSLDELLKQADKIMYNHKINKKKSLSLLSPTNQ